MIYQTANIFCSRYLTISNLYPKSNAADGCVFSGFNGNNVFRSFLYFDINGFPTDAVIYHAVLRIYLRRLISANQQSELSVLPLLSEFDSKTSFINQPEYMDAAAALKICRNYQGWLDFDITSAFCRWSKMQIYNYGLMLMSNEDAISIFDILASPQCDYMQIPHLIVYYTSHGHDCRPDKASILVVRERCWDLHFKGKEILPPVNVERIKEGTFFVKNEGTKTIKAIIETGADTQNFAEDSCYEVPPEGTTGVVARLYGKYYRLTLICDDRSSAQVRFICQDYN